MNRKPQAVRLQTSDASGDTTGGQLHDLPVGYARVRDGVRASILAGEYAPEQRLIESDLCSRFGASRFAVRAALQELAAVGLVVLQRNRGARVRTVSLSEAIEITEVRGLIESFVAARAAERVSPDQASALQTILEEMHAAVAGAELVRYSELNVRLHRVLREISGHEVSARLLAQLRDLTARHRFTLSLVPGRSEASLRQHDAIVAAVVRGDARAAASAMQDHLRSVADALAQLAVATGGALALRVLPAFSAEDVAGPPESSAENERHGIATQLSTI